MTIEVPQRVLFEKWMRDNYSKLSLAKAVRHDGYDSVVTAMMWKVWQSRCETT
jgi:hypothetical protein